MRHSKPKIIFACGREPEYIRNRMIWQTLDQAFEARLIADSRPGSLTLRLARLLPRLLYHLQKPHDLLVIGFYGHPLVLLARSLTRAPILFDAFVSTYDTLCFDRQIFAPQSLRGRLAFHLDKAAGSYADKVCLDTHTHAAYFQQTFNIPAQKIGAIYLGCDEKIFDPTRFAATSDNFTVFTYSTYLPLHGVETIIEAARRCRNYPILFRLVGDKGQTYQYARQLAAGYRLDNVEFLPTLPFERLVREMSTATICLGGHFGATPKAGRVIAGKTYQFLAMGKPVIVGDNPANRELFEHAQTAYFCRMNDPDALAKAIINLFQDRELRDRLADQGSQFFDNHLTWPVLGQKLIDLVEEML